MKSEERQCKSEQYLNDLMWFCQHTYDDSVTYLVSEKVYIDSANINILYNYIQHIENMLLSSTWHVYVGKVYVTVQTDVGSCLFMQVFAEKMGLETGWNCHISLTPNGDSPCDGSPSSPSHGSLHEDLNQGTCVCQLQYSISLLMIRMSFKTTRLQTSLNFYAEISMVEHDR